MKTDETAKCRNKDLLMENQKNAGIGKISVVQKVAMVHVCTKEILQDTCVFYITGNFDEIPCFCCRK